LAPHEDRKLFTDAEGIESLWAASSGLLDDPPPLHSYAPGSYGPQKMHELIAPQRWSLPEEAATPRSWKEMSR
jgi:glucose-6-phosphate 1-dehydrogenase